MNYTVVPLTPSEARRLCPVCRKYNPKMDDSGWETPMCLYRPDIILDEEKHQCLFAKYAGRSVIQVHCDFCNRELKGMRFIEGVHKPPPPTVDNLYVCKQCIMRPEHHQLRVKMGMKE